MNISLFWLSGAILIFSTVAFLLGLFIGKIKKERLRMEGWREGWLTGWDDYKKHLLSYKKMRE